MYMYINTTPSLSLSHRACRRHHLLLVISWWHSPCTLHRHGDGGGRPGSRCRPPCRHPHPPCCRPPCQAGWWWWWDRPCRCAPRLTRPPHRRPCRHLIIMPLPLIVIIVVTLVLLVVVVACGQGITVVVCGQGVTVVVCGQGVDGGDSWRHRHSW